MKTLQRFNACRKSKNLQFFDFYEHPRKISFLPKTFFGINASTHKSLICSIAMLTFSTIAYAQNGNNNGNGGGNGNGNANNPIQWKLNGNQASNSDFIGTTNNQKVVFKSNNVVALEIQPDTSSHFMGDVVVEPLKPVTPLPPGEVNLVTVNNQGKLTSLDKSGLLSAIYSLPQPCITIPNAPLPTPVWSATSGILFTGTPCPAKVGIGTDNPNATLDVRGTGYFTSYFGINTVPTNQYQLHVNNSVGTTAGIYLNTNHPQNWPNVKYGFQNVINNPNTIAYSVTDATTNQDVFVVMGDGKTGIGTANPEGDLQVRSGPTKLAVGSSAGKDLGWGTSYIGFNAVRTANYTWGTSGDGAHNGGAIIYGDIFGSIIFSTIPFNGNTNQTNIADATVKENTRLFIHRDGNVGIGTTAVLGAKLSVEGSIRARKIQVDNPSLGWSDFVFDENYQLPTLEYVESFITNNHHLPDVPSASEVAANGIDLAQMDAILLQKIEELTLYLLQLKKENDSLKEKIILLETK